MECLLLGFYSFVLGISTAMDHERVNNLSLFDPVFHLFVVNVSDLAEE